RIKLGSERVYQAATAPGQSGGERASEASKRVGMATITALGFEKERRDLAKSLGVDPYTPNPVLSEKLTNAAWGAFSGRFVIQTATSILVPYSMAMSAVTITNTSIYDTPAADLINADTAIFNETGATEQQVQALMQNQQYSLSVLTDLALAIRRLQGVPGRDAVVIFAAAARTQVETRFMAGARRPLPPHHHAGPPPLPHSAPPPSRSRRRGPSSGAPRPERWSCPCPSTTSPGRSAWPASRSARTSRRPSTWASSRAGCPPWPTRNSRSAAGSSTRASPSRPSD